MRSFLNSILDKSIFFSFDHSGFERHQKSFNEKSFSKNLAGKTSLVTGGTAGIGLVVAQTLVKLGSKVIVTGRDESKGKTFEQNNLTAVFQTLDMGDWAKLKDFCISGSNYDYIVLNAGSMPEKYSLNHFGVESQCASQLVGHYLLIHFLKKYGKINPNSRIVWVSSGGMYLKQLDLLNLFESSHYDKVSTYANVKRAQVTVVEEMAQVNEWAPYSVFSMHPGWVATEGVRDALPRFNKFMKNRLRPPTEGADTILWLLITEETLCSGGFYFDRKKVNTYFTSKYNPSMDLRLRLMKKLNGFIEML